MGNVQVTTARATEATLRQMSDRVSALVSVLSTVPGTPKRVLYDYEARSDSQPVYKGVSTTSTNPADGNWTVTRYTYDVDDRVVDEQVIIGSWSSRNVLGWV